MSTAPQHVDITPTPRVLRILGDIPFPIWRCFAELADNSLDAFADAQRNGLAIDEPRVSITWSKNEVLEAAKEIEIQDNGPGMTLDQLQNAARAGYSSNDPINNLGLFGMGFNIATARLGDKTRLLAATASASEWVGIEIDFSALIASKSFSAPVITIPKTDPAEHGTRIVISSLKDGVSRKLRSEESDMRRQLERIYTTILSEKAINLQLQGKLLSPYPHCIWSEERYVVRKGANFQAFIPIERDLGVALFDQQKNRYLSRDEEADTLEDERAGNALPAHIVRRHKRLKGWVGIQRYADPNDFGLDFIRNGRKILIGDKTLFNYANPLTGTLKLEYPTELGSTWGGRIVGEIHVDYLIPTYQKDNFDRNDPAWDETVEALRGIGPMLPKDRKAMSFPDPNTSPLGLLINAFRRLDPGTRNLAIPHNLAKTFSKNFRAGHADFQSDEKWWKCAQEQDQERASGTGGASTPVNSGDGASDSADDYGPDVGNGTSATTTVDPSTTPTTKSTTKGDTAPQDSTLDQLIQSSEKIVKLSRKFAYSDTPPLSVSAFKLKSGRILRSGKSVPCLINQDGTEIDFIYNPSHPFISQFPVDPEHLLAIYLADKFNARDRGTDPVHTFEKLMTASMSDLKIDKVSLQERADSLFTTIREQMLELLLPRATDVLEVIHQSAGEVEDTVSSLLQAEHSLVAPFQSKCEEAFAAIAYVPHRALLRLVDAFPGELFDGCLFNSPYTAIFLPDPNATDRIRKDAKDRILTFLQDALWILHKSTNASKEELLRASHSLTFLENEIE